MAAGALSERKKVLSGLDSRGLDKVGNIFVGIMAGIVVLTLVAVYLFVGTQSYQTFTVDHISLGTFLTSKDWNGAFGTLVLTVGTLTLVIFGLLVAVPLSFGIAFFITEIAPPWLGRILRGIVELFLGIPSIIFGLLGVVLIIPLIVDIFTAITGDKYFTTGRGIFAAAIVVAFMVMPTITTISVDALSAIPRELREGSLALGATRWQTMTKTLLPAALPGMMTGVVLGAARIIGESIAVALVIGGSTQLFPIDHLKNGQLFIGSTSGITTVVLNDFGDATSGEPLYHALWTLAFMLLIISGLLVFASRALISRRIYK